MKKKELCFFRAAAFGFLSISTLARAGSSQAPAEFDLSKVSKYLLSEDAIQDWGVTRHLHFEGCKGHYEQIEGIDTCIGTETFSAGTDKKTGKVYTGYGLVIVKEKAKSGGIFLKSSMNLFPSGSKIDCGGKPMPKAGTYPCDVGLVTAFLPDGTTIQGEWKNWKFSGPVTIKNGDWVLRCEKSSPRGRCDGKAFAENTKTGESKFLVADGGSQGGVSAAEVASPAAASNAGAVKAGSSSDPFAKLNALASLQPDTGNPIIPWDDGKNGYRYHYHGMGTNYIFNFSPEKIEISRYIPLLADLNGNGLSMYDMEAAMIKKLFEFSPRDVVIVDGDLSKLPFANSGAFVSVGLRCKAGNSCINSTQFTMRRNIEGLKNFSNSTSLYQKLKENVNFGDAEVERAQLGSINLFFKIPEGESPQGYRGAIMTQLQAALM